MESFPQALLRRELGFSCTPGLPKKFLTQLTWKEEDRMIISAGNPIYSMEFCPDQPKILALSDEIGGVSLVDTQTNAKNKIISRYQCHESSLYTVGWYRFQSNIIATGGSDQMVRVWDTTTFQRLAVYSGHSKTVRKVRFHSSRANLLTSCGRDGTILLWDLRSSSNFLAENEICCAHSKPSRLGGSHVQPGKGRRRKIPPIPTAVTDFVFVDDNILISSGATDGQIKFWDMRKTYKYLQKVEPVDQFGNNSCSGYSSICLDGIGNLYASSALDNILRFRLFGDSKEPDTIFQRRRSDYCVAIDITPDGRYLISGSPSSFAYVWDTWDNSSRLPFVQLEGTLNTSLSTPCTLFSPDDPHKIVTGSDDSNLTIWRLNTETDSGPPAFQSDTTGEMEMAPLDCKEGKIEPVVPKFKKPPLPTKSLHLNNLPNFVLDGQLPHLAILGRKIRPKHTLQTWLANFSKPKPSSVSPIKKSVKKNTVIAC